MKTIWKYSIPFGNLSAMFALPDGAKVLHVAAQQNDIVLWAEVDSDAPKQLREFVVTGTGYELPAGRLTYLGTAQLVIANLVFHVFEKA